MDINIVKNRKNVAISNFLPDLKSVLNIRTGNKTSRYFRHIFEHKNIKKYFGTNLAILMISSFTFGNVQIPNNDDFVNGSHTHFNNVSLETRKGVRLPLDNFKPTQGYSIFHPALDFDGVTGDNVYPFSEGTVKDVGYSNYGYGNAVLIDHGNGITSLYAHLSKINVERGQFVATNSVIGHVGSTGKAFGDHLHFEIRENGFPVNPQSFLP
jgi:murein DD-endopeptidase MepM/ murein hydrolase activator NlpD